MSAADADLVIRRGGGAEQTGSDPFLPTPEQLCLVRAATGPAASVEEALQEWRGLVDLRGPIDGGSYRLIPMVYHRLQAEGVDDPNRALFKGVYRRSMVAGSQLLDSVTPALRALSAAGITPWTLKGAAFVLAGYYPTVASRPMADVDLAVDSAQRLSAISALREIGYVAQLGDLHMAQIHGAAFVGPDGHEVDLHWHHLSNARGDAEDEILTRTWIDTELNGVPVRIPGPTALLIATLVHGLVPNVEPPVRWLVDASLILDRDGDQVRWDEVVDFAIRFRLTRRIERALNLLADATHHRPPAGVMDSLGAAPTGVVERLEHQLRVAPKTSFRRSVLRLVVGYAGSDRRFRHAANGLPRFVAGRWGVEHRYQLPVEGCRRLIRRVRYGPRP